MVGSPGSQTASRRRSTATSPGSGATSSQPYDPESAHDTRVDTASSVSVLHRLVCTDVGRCSTVTAGMCGATIEAVPV